MTNHSITKGLVSSKEIAKAVKLSKFGLEHLWVDTVKVIKNIYT